ncbi:MAG: SDR family oxidoreductase [Kiloniellaceae bacterium]
MSKLFSLDDKVVLITGASRGLGWSMAEAMAEAGAELVLCGRDEALLQDRVETLETRGAKAAASAFDVTDRKAAVEAIHAAVETHGRLDVLVNNAGIQHREPMTELADADWDRVLDTNLSACFVLAREAARHMVSRGHGRIINTVSIMGPLARPTVSVYVAAKGGLAALTRALAVELGAKGVTCNGIAPGFFATEMNRVLTENPEFDAFVRGRVPLGRWGEPPEVGGAAVFLASDAASYVNGQILFVDGGLSVAV